VESYEGAERREYRRVPTNLVVGYRRWESREGFAFTQPSDISQGGLRLHTDRRYTPGTRLDVSLKPTLQAPPVKVSGEVLASREIVAEAIYDTRLRFTDLDAMSLYALGEYIRMAGP
jgi:hypothetical protein